MSRITHQLGSLSGDFDVFIHSEKQILLQILKHFKLLNYPNQKYQMLEFQRNFFLYGFMYRVWKLNIQFQMEPYRKFQVVNVIRESRSSHLWIKRCDPIESQFCSCHCRWNGRTFMCYANTQKQLQHQQSCSLRCSLFV